VKKVFVGGVFVLCTMLLGGRVVAAQTPSATVAGRVSITGPDGQPMVLPGVTLTLTCGSGNPRTEVSGPQGEFQFADLPPAAGGCSIVANLDGFKSATTSVVLKTGEMTEVSLQLGLDTLSEEVTVSAKADATDAASLASGGRLAAGVMQTAPIASERFQAALPLIPGVVRGPDGLLNIGGARSNQSATFLNDANGADPVTGEDATDLPIDAVASVQVRVSDAAPEFGDSAGGVTTVDTLSAGDRWHATVNDLEPRLRRRGGTFRGIESFTPRVTAGGPIVKGRLGLLESVQYEFSQTRVFGLPPLESDTKVQSLVTFSRADWTPSSTHHVIGSAMVAPRKTTYAGLNPFNPQPVTPTIEHENAFGAASDQIVLGDQGVLEVRLSARRFGANIYPSQGTGPMVLAPDVNSGSYFNDQDRTGRRVEWATSYAFAPSGPHLFKAGLSATRESVDGVSRNRPIRIVRADGTLSQLITFDGRGDLSRDKTAVQGYAQDTWTVHPRLTAQYGARYGYDSVAGAVNLAPRGTVTILATPDGRTVVRGGAGVFYGAVPLNVASFDQMQRRVVTLFAEDGITTLGPSVEWTNVVASRLRVPRSVGLDATVDREWLPNVFVRVGYRQRSGRYEPIVDAANGTILLQSDGRSRYREAQISARYEFHGADQIVASYTRSSAVGDLNEFNQFFGNIEDPVITPNARAPLPWDAPHRVLLWSSLTLPRGFAVFPVLDVRSGFPLSNVDADRNFVGPRNAGRYPTFASLDAQVTKKLRVFGHRATIGLKVFNVTNHFNPRDYQGNLASRAFGSFANSVGRTFRGKWVFEF
jgi:carboxypeptidase family protein